MHLDDTPNEAVEVVAYPFTINRALNELDTGATDDLREFAFPEFFERRRIVRTLALQVFCRKLILCVVSMFFATEPKKSWISSGVRCNRDITKRVHPLRMWLSIGSHCPFSKILRASAPMSSVTLKKWRSR